jgi:hypothetical protein
VACTTSGKLKTETATALGGFVESYYWSSSERYVSAAWNQSFQYGTQNGTNNNGTRYVRPVRAFGAPSQPENNT